MITCVLIILLVISLGLNVLAVILIKKLLKKIDLYEQWIIDLKDTVTDTVALMRNLDKQGTFATSLNDKGNFESDDQVGQVFKDLLNVIEELDRKIQ